MKFTLNDLYEMQDCLEGYKVLLGWLPDITDEDKALKDNKLNIIKHLIDKTEKVMGDIIHE